MSRFIFIQLNKVKPFSHLLNNENFTWLYLGKNIGARNLVSGYLGKSNRMALGRHLQNVALQQKKKFLDDMAELGAAQKNKRYWWASNFAYKCPLTSDFFLILCYAGVVEKLIADRNVNGFTKYIVVVEDRWLFRYLRSRYGQNQKQFEFVGRASVIAEIFNACLRGITTRIYFILDMLYVMLFSRWLSKRSILQKIPDTIQLAYLYSWIEPRCLDKDKIYSDPYLGRLDEIVQNFGIKAIRLAPLTTSSPLIRQAMKTADFVLPGKYLSFADIFQSAFAILRIRIPTTSVYAATRTLIWREIFYEFSRLAFQKSLVHFAVFKRLFSEDTKRKIFIAYPFENQPWERMLCMAAEEFGQRIQTIGYQHASVPPLILNYFSASNDVDDAPVPKYLVANGSHPMRIFQNNGYRRSRILNGGALRYANSQMPSQSNHGRKHPEKIVLIVLPALRSLSEELLTAVLEAFHNAKNLTCNFWIRCHPDVPITVLGTDISTWPDHFRLAVGSITVLLQRVDLVVSFSSTVGLEAILYGVPIVKYLPASELDLDILDESEDPDLLVCDETNIKEVVAEILSKSKSHKTQTVKAQQERYRDYFTPVDEKVWAKIVQS